MNNRGVHLLGSRRVVKIELVIVFQNIDPATPPAALINDALLGIAPANLIASQMIGSITGAEMPWAEFEALVKARQGIPTEAPAAEPQPSGPRLVDADGQPTKPEDNDGA